jgi:hypothetical protein
VNWRFFFTWIVTGWGIGLTVGILLYVTAGTYGVAAPSVMALLGMWVGGSLGIRASRGTNH